ncbi:hypothetical protein JZK55_22190 [Dissulfurispira thermophila]|uniref:Spore protein YkvP/CgeB glycosyl transferase-like domain-containing protein n=1 Tax=Dissulfurispira thermophila TaxID=2715679 RepID=A0A7G1H6C7_9BACT|nr:glycosyltransferase [Dissulfurispira thermophila]BCB97297.1 hypothetical protein JZK55_22190 [Dissulfurispira thermophila]
MGNFPKIIVSYFFGHNSIPLGASCVRALQALNYEVLCFNSGINNPLEKYFFKPINKIFWNVGLKKIDISKNSPWNNQKFIQKLLENAVAEFKPDILFILRGHGFDGEYLQYLKKQYKINKIVGWWVKGPKWFDLMLYEAKFYDHFFCIHKEGYTAEDKIEYLPAIAVDDILYRPLHTGSNKQYTNNVVFVGSWTQRRQDIIEELTGYPISIYGPKWLRKNILNFKMCKMIKSNSIWGEKLIELYNKTKIVINISQWDTSNLSGLNLRIFDIPACGTFLITDYSDDLKEFFRLGKEIETFKDKEELKDKIAYYLRNDDERERIAMNGYKKVLRLGTYKDKMAELLRRISFT